MASGLTEAASAGLARSRATSEKRRWREGSMTGAPPMPRTLPSALAVRVPNGAPSRCTSTGAPGVKPVPVTTMRWLSR